VSFKNENELISENFNETSKNLNNTINDKKAHEHKIDADEIIEFSRNDIKDPKKSVVPKKTLKNTYDDVIKKEFPV